MHEFNSVEDFAANESFQDFVLEKNQESVEKWQQYILNNSQKLQHIEKASLLIKKLSPGDIIAMKKPLNVPNAFSSSITIGKALVFCAILLLIGSITYFQLSHTNETEVTEVIIAEAGVKKTMLPDGSIAILKPNSTIKILGDWKTSRNAIVDGIASFNIKKDLARPFNLSTKEGDIKVLGTKFSVFGDKVFSVVLSEGSILFSDKKGKTYTLKPNEILIKRNGVFKKENTDASAFSYWEDDKIAFKNDKLSRVVYILNKSYGMDISVDDESLLEKSISAQVPENNPELILSAIAEIYNIELIRDGDKFILK